MGFSVYMMHISKIFILLTNNVPNKFVLGSLPNVYRKMLIYTTPNLDKEMAPHYFSLFFILWIFVKAFFHFVPFL